MNRSHGFVVGLCLFLLVSLGGNAYLYAQFRQNEMSLSVLQAMLEAPGPTDTLPEDELMVPIYVHVVGAVQCPGLYRLQQGDRVFQALEAAGGSTEEADLRRINLAATLQDGQQVLVPDVGEESVSPLQQASPTPSNAMVNINTASATLLETLPGIGPSKANAIIEYRSRIGPFQQIEDVIKVSGIGPVTFDNIKDRITVR